MESLLDGLECIYLMLCALNPPMIEHLVRDALEILLQIEKCVWQQAFIVDTSIATFDLLMAFENLKR